MRQEMKKEGKLSSGQKNMYSKSRSNADSSNKLTIQNQEKRKKLLFTEGNVALLKVLIFHIVTQYF